LVELLIAAAGILGLLLLFRIVITIVAYFIAWSVRVFPLVGRRGMTSGARSAREPLKRGD
jgi:hypothetical protein